MRDLLDAGVRHVAHDRQHGLHKLFSAVRDPYNIIRSSGLRILIDADAGWRLLAVPSIFEIGLSDCRWIYRLSGARSRCGLWRRATIRRCNGASRSRASPAGSWSSATLSSASANSTKPAGSRSTPRADVSTFRPDPSSLWGQRYPDAVYHLVTSTPDAIEAIGGDELLYADGKPRDGAYVALRTRATRELRFAVVGSMTDPEAAGRLAVTYERSVEDGATLAPAAGYWERITRRPADHRQRAWRRGAPYHAPMARA